MNKVMLLGRLTKDVDCRVAAGKNGDMTISRYTLAVDRKGEGTDFLPCVCFGKTADFAQKYLTKGMRILVEGRIQTGSYEKDGRKVYTTDIVVENHYFCESKREEKPADPVDDFMMNIPEDIIDEMPFGRKGAEE